MLSLPAARLRWSGLEAAHVDVLVVELLGELGADSGHAAEQGVDAAEGCEADVEVARGERSRRDGVGRVEISLQAVGHQTVLAHHPVEAVNGETGVDIA